MSLRYRTTRLPLLTLILLALVLLSPMAWCVEKVSAEKSGAKKTSPTTSIDALPRHPLELKALTEPQAVLAELPAILLQAQIDKDYQQQALLHLAKANACRVIADWSCQRIAGTEASKAAELANVPLLHVRGLIAEARAAMATKDFSAAKNALSQAGVLLKENPSPDLFADVMLAYSTFSQDIGKHVLAAQYAERGLAALQGEQALAMQCRLLRNLARAKNTLTDYSAARVALEKAQVLAKRIQDPKLTAELFLEVARAARAQNDIPAQIHSAEQILAMSAQLQNTQLIGIAHETFGLAYQADGQLDKAMASLTTAHTSFRVMGLDSDERRAIRELIVVNIALHSNDQTLWPLLERMLQLDDLLDKRDRALAADDFDARLKYAQQQMDVQRLEVESKLSKERETALKKSNQLSLIVSILIAVVVIVLAVFFVQQRRTNGLLRSAFSKLHASQSQTQELLRLNPGFVFLLDTNGRIQQANPAFAFALGCSPKAVNGRSLQEFLFGDSAEVMQAYLRRVIELRKDDSVISMRDAQGGERKWQLASRLSAATADRSYIVGSGVDVTEQIHDVERLRDQSLRDALTGCWNRRYLDEFASQRSDARWAVIGIDLDGFKQINDQQGHERGDEVLQEFARFLGERVRGEDAVVRIGGDEFLILLARSEVEIMQRLLNRLTQDADMASCGFSLGSARREGDEPLSATLARADAAMYETKREHHRQRT